MARRARLKSKLDNQAYHVMTRTCRRAFFFHDEVAKEWVYREILRLAEVFCVDLYAVTVMSNHYHIVLSVRKPTLSESEVQARFERYQSALKGPCVWREWLFNHWANRLTDLSVFMQELNCSIARHVNRRDKTDGHVFGGRFKSVLIDDDAGLLRCMAYVEMNCVRAGLCATPIEYRHCSVGRYHQGGRRAAGVTIPDMPFLRWCRSDKARQRAFALYANHLACLELGHQPSFPIEIKVLRDMVDHEDMADLVFRRTQWAVRSLVLGSRQFCRDTAVRYGLPTVLRGGEPFPISNSLCNTHQRAGPHVWT